MERGLGCNAEVPVPRLTNGVGVACILQHNATVSGGVPSLNIIVVPDSGTEELAGLSVAMGINFDNGAHSYDFEFTIRGA